MERQDNSIFFLDITHFIQSQIIQSTCTEDFTADLPNYGDLSKTYENFNSKELCVSFYEQYST
jgi:hypothetical protein